MFIQSREKTFQINRGTLIYHTPTVSISGSLSFAEQLFHHENRFVNRDKILGYNPTVNVWQLRNEQTGCTDQVHAKVQAFLQCVYKESSQELSSNRSRVVLKSLGSGPRITQEWSSNCSEVVLESLRSSPRITQEWSLNHSGVVLKLLKSGAGITQRSGPQITLGVILELLKSGPRITLEWSSNRSGVVLESLWSGLRITFDPRHQPPTAESLGTKAESRQDLIRSWFANNSDSTYSIQTNLAVQSKVLNWNGKRWRRKVGFHLYKANI